MEAFPWIALTITLVGNYFVNHQDIKGQYIWILANIAWLIYATFINRIPAQIIMYIVFTVMNIHGIYKWTQLKKQSNQ